MPRYIALASSLDWLTPPDIVQRVRIALGGSIDLDPCSKTGSRVGATLAYSLPETDGLKEPWNRRRIFVHPPYGRCHVHRTTRDYKSAAEFRLLDRTTKKYYTSTTIYEWIECCAAAHAAGSDVIALIPAAVDTQHWQRIIFQTASMVCFAEGRIKFDLPAEYSEKKIAPPMSTSLVYWGRHETRFAAAFNEVGKVLHISKN